MCGPFRLTLRLNFIYNLKDKQQQQEQQQNTTESNKKEKRCVYKQVL